MSSLKPSRRHQLCLTVYTVKFRWLMFKFYRAEMACILLLANTSKWVFTPRFVVAYGA